MEELVRISKKLAEDSRENNYKQTRQNWKEVLPKIKRRKQELLKKLLEEVEVKYAEQGNHEQSRIEKQAAEELLNMSPAQVEKCVRDYDIFTDTHRSLLEDPERGFRLEAQRHWIPTLISEMKNI